MPRLFLYLTAAIVLVVLLNFIAPFYLESRPNSSNSASPSLRQEFVVKDSAASNSDATDEELHKYDLSKIDAEELTSRVEELLSIRVSVLTELRVLERNRSVVIKQISERNNELEKLKTQIIKRAAELERLQLHIKQAALAQKEAKDQVGSLVEPPLDILPKQAQKAIFTNESLRRSNFLQDDFTRNVHCQMFSCFDYSRCSLFSPFFVYVYNLHQLSSFSESTFNYQLFSVLKSNVHITSDPNVACVYMVILYQNFTILHDRDKLQNYLLSLPHWGGDGRNNIIVNTNSSFDILQTGVNPMKAMLLQTQFNEYNYRNKYDLIVPSMYSLSTAKASEFSPVFSPARRKYFISFLGQVNEEADDDSSTKNSNTDLQVVVKDALLKLVAKHSRAAYNEFLFDFDCDEKTKQLCENQTIILLDSTFTIIMPTASHSSQSFLINPIIYDNQLNSKIMNAFVTGAIPILVGGDFISLPFNEAIDWDRALIRIPTAHITELYVVLKTFTDSDIIEMRRFGSNIYHNYFSDLKQLVDTIVALFRFNRLKIPSPPAANEHSEFYLNQSKFDQNLLSNQSDLTQSASFYRPKIYSDDEENVGPLEVPFSSLVYQRNFTIPLAEQYSSWNNLHHSPFYTFPSLPYDPVLPSESKFIGSSFRARPIGEGAGGSGREFSEALGGNFMSEQFTIVILTYERENILLSALQRLKDLPYLNKVIVVWNSPNPPTPGIKWPEIGVDILVIKSKHNSLNNRFLPFEEIKTDAVLSMDDDASFRHDEIIFAFRVWREARDRIVGFPARYHAWDAAHSTWLYNSNYTCEFSMILTGAAFYHKYYSYLYTHWMPAAIRNKVDEYMNCEDIAMNFLVSHVSRLPPIKVTSRWTFRCPECSSSLSEDDRHYQRRHRCLNYFASVYGYMPLLYTQFRADSVLFKTRIPHDKQKCFKFI